MRQVCASTREFCPCRREIAADRSSSAYTACAETVGWLALWSTCYREMYLSIYVSWLRVYKDAEMLITRFHVAIVCNGL